MPKKVGLTSALTLTLSPGEREQYLPAFENSVVIIAIAGCLLFAEKAVQQFGTPALARRGELFSLSWGRGAG
jgi:hypothetical protein